ncbi:MAG: NnrU family protein [Gammaproteobacteria bacterium]|nr:NnrU family protein [Gammaproteobacteria bacterium]
MELLIIGLFVFLGMHSVSVIALPLRDRLAAKNELAWKAFYGVVSLIGIILICRGYVQARLTPTVIYAPPLWLRHVSALLLLPTFALFLAPYFPGRLTAAVKHPQLVAVILWAIAHLLVNGMLADVLLFGAFLVWAVTDLMSFGRRPARPVPHAPASPVNDIILLIAGLGLYVVTALWLHRWMTGLAPFA